MGQAQQQKGDECDRNLDADGVLGGADEAGDLEGLLDPAKEQFDGPAPTIKISDFLCAGIEIIRQDTQYGSAVGHDPHFAHRVLHWIATTPGLACGKEADAVGEDVAALGEALYEVRDRLPTLRAHNEQAMAHAAIAFAKQSRRRRMMACTSSIGPGATNMVTAAAVAHANRLPVLLLAGDNRLKNGAPPERIREAWEQALAAAREGGIEEQIRPFVEARLADLDRTSG